MGTIRYQEVKVTHLAEGIQRRLGYTDHLMMAVYDFDGSPQAQPDPPHSHPHEQVSYVVEGEILFFLDGVPTRLGPGDMFAVPSNRPHTIQRLTGRARLVDCFTPVREDFLK